MKRIVALLLAAVFCVGFFACGDDSSTTAPIIDNTPELFSYEGMTVTLTKDFYATSHDGYLICYDSHEVTVFVTKEPFLAASGLRDMTLEEFTDLLCKKNSYMNPVRLGDVDGLTCIEHEYTNVTQGVTYKYFWVVLKGPDALWLVQFACDKTKYDNYKPRFIEWARGIELH